MLNQTMKYNFEMNQGPTGLNLSSGWHYRHGRIYIIQYRRLTCFLHMQYSRLNIDKHNLSITPSYFIKTVQTF